MESKKSPAGLEQWKKYVAAWKSCNPRIKNQMVKP